MDYQMWVTRITRRISGKEKLDYFRQFIAGIEEFENVFAMNNMVTLIAKNRGSIGNTGDLRPDEVIQLYKEHARLVDAKYRRQMVGQDKS
eukprot:scaffold9578_cov85-Skeletonema_dohrnii-CCMP3373.AAC.3